MGRPTFPGRSGRLSPRARRGARLAVALAALLGTNAALAAPAVPVRVGGDFEFPACAARGILNERSAVNGRVGISSGPTQSFQAIDRLPVGAEVFLCDENGTFIGIVYGEGDCGLADPIERRAAYRGSCSSGWVHNRSVDAVPEDDIGGAPALLPSQDNAPS